jgi:hypothetical protein
MVEHDQECLSESGACELRFNSRAMAFTRKRLERLRESRSGRDSPACGWRDAMLKMASPEANKYRLI